MFGVLIRIDAQDAAGDPAPLYLSSLDTPELCHLDGLQWFPALAELPELAYDFFGGAFNGQITAPRMGFAVDTGDLAAFSERRYAAARVRLWAGDITGPDVGAPPAVGPLELWFDGKLVAEPAQAEDRRARFMAAVSDEWLDEPLLPLFGGTGGLDGPDDATGSTKPLALGNLRFATGALIDPVENIWMVSHAGFDSMSVVYDRVARLGTSFGDYADLATLVAADVPAGRWATCAAEGLVKTGAPPDGKIAFDLLGDNAGAGGTVLRAGAMIARVAELKGGTVNAASLAALDVARPYDLALQIVGQTTARAVIQQMADSVGAVAGVSWTGELFAQPLAIGTPVATLAADDTSQIAVTAVEEREKAAPFWRLATQAEPTWQVYDQGEVALDFTWRGPWNVLRTYRLDDLVTDDDGASWVYINTTPSAGNPLPISPATSNTWWELFGAGGATAAQIAAINAAQADAAQALIDAASAQATADGKVTTFRQAGTPTGDLGDLWYKTDTGKWYQAASAGSNQIIAGEWELATDPDAAQALLDAAGAQATADGKITTFVANRVSVQPSAVLDFRNKLLSHPITYTRAGNATVINAQGLIETVGPNVIRYTHDPITRRRALLPEPAATNLIPDHKATAATWAATGSTNTDLTGNHLGKFPGLQVASSGNVVNRATIGHGDLVNGTQYTVQAYYIVGTSGRARIEISGGGVSVFINATGPAGALIAGTQTGGVISKVKNIDMGGGVWRADVTFTPSVTVSGYATGIGPDSAVVGETVIALAAQLETGPVATSVIESSGGTATRNADNASIQGQDFLDFFNASEGTLVVDAIAPGTPQTSAFTGVVSLNGGTTSEELYIGRSSGLARAFVADGGVNQASLNAGAWADGAFARTALGYKLNDFALVLDGGIPSTDDAGTLPTPDRMGIGHRAPFTGLFGGLIEQIRFYPKRLTNTELQSLTAFPTADGVGDLFVDENDRNRTYRWDGTEWQPVVSSVATAIEDQAPAATDATIEQSADVTKSIQGTSLIEVAYDSDGTVKSGQFPINRTFKLVSASGVEITSGITWAVTTETGGWSSTAPSITGTGSGVLSINSGPNVSTATIQVTATFNGKPYAHTTDVKQKLDAPPVSAATSASQSVFAAVNSSGAWVDLTTVMRASTGASITNFDLTAASFSLDPNDLTDPIGSANFQLQWLWRVIGGTFATVGAVADSSPDPQIVDEGEGLKSGLPGSITCNRQQTGLTGGTEYEFKLQGRWSSGTLLDVNASGTASIEGGT